MSIADDSNERDVILSMISTLRKVDELLAKMWANFDKGPNKSLVLTDAILDSVRDELGTESTPNKLREIFEGQSFLPQEKSSSNLSSSLNKIKVLVMPMSLLSYKKNVSFKLPREEELEGKLIEQNQGIVVKGTDVWVDEVDAYYFHSEVEEPLNKNKRKNESDSYQAETRYSQIILRISQLIYDLDLQLSYGTVKALALRALSICCAWTIEHVTKMSIESINKFLGKHKSGYFIVKAVNKSHLVHCHINARQWANDFYGIGMTLESTCRLDIYWKPKAQAVLEEDLMSNDAISNHQLSSSGIITSIACKVTQGFPLRSLYGESNTVFKECQSWVEEFDKVNDYDHFDTIILDVEQGFVSINVIRQDHLQPKLKMLPRLNTNTNEIDTSEKTSDKKVQKEIIVERSSLKATVAMINSAEREKEVNEYEILDEIVDTELFGWGDDAYNCLAVSRKNIGIGEKIIFNPVCAMEIVKSVETSCCHTLVLTSFGSVYSCGDGSDGQLGHGSLDSYKYLRHINSFRKKDGNLIVITQVSAGADESSSHSAAIDSDGNLYLWGKAVLCGNIGYEIASTGVKKGGIRSKRGDPVILPCQVQYLKGYRILQVTCGGSYTVVRAIRNNDQNMEKDMDSRHSNVSHTSNNKGVYVFSWGLNSEGRLGLGKPKVEVESTHFQLGMNRKKVPRYQISPTLISKLENYEVVHISAGKAHALAATSKGEVFAWGRNNAGQCSKVCTHSSLLKSSETNISNEQQNFVSEVKFLEDVWIPRKIPKFGERGIIATLVSAGGIHSSAVDCNGSLYTWGGGGEECLGHGEISQYKYGINHIVDQRMRHLLKLSGHIRIPKWMLPRKVENLKHEKVVHVSLGSKHGAVYTKSGTIYQWGDYKCSNRPFNDEQFNNTTTGKGLLPSQPSIGYLQEVMGRKFECVSCGGNHTIAIISGHSIGHRLGKELYQKCIIHSKKKNSYDDNSQLEEDCDEAYIYFLPGWFCKGSSKSLSSIDCAIIVGGRRLYCHKIVVASRSPVLKIKIISEEQPGANSHVEIFLPDINNEAAKSLIKFMYTDTITTRDVLTFSSTFNLWQASERLAIKKLSDLCKSILETTYDFKVNSQKEMDYSKLTYMNNYLSVSTITSDMMMALDNDRWTDVKIITCSQEKVLLAHSCIICSASIYFQSLISNTRFTTEDDGVIIIKVTEGYHKIQRAMICLYTGKLMNGSSNEEILEDIITAEKYKFSNMKRQCESAISVTLKNCIKVLCIAIKIDSIYLKSKAIIIVSQNIVKLFENKELKRDMICLLREYPQKVVDELFEHIKQSKGAVAIIPMIRTKMATEHIERTNEIKNKLRNEVVAEIIGKPKDMKRSIIGLFSSIIAVIIFSKYSSTLGPIIPIVNVSVLIFGAKYIIQNIN